jgi:hypothetical protein
MKQSQSARVKNPERQASVLRVLLFVVSLSLPIFISRVAFAAGSGITYQGRILKPGGTPLEGSNVQFKLQIRTPDSGSCLMYEEIQSLNMVGSSGSFDLTINSGLGVRTDSTGLTLERIFANRGSFTFDGSTCTSGSAYIPNSGDGRVLQVSFKDETMSAWEPIPPSNINFVPFAFESKQVQGFGADSLLRVVDGSGDPLTGLAPLSNAQYTALMSLADGSSNAYTKLGQLNGAALPTMSAGEVLGWNGTSWVSTTSTPGADSIAATMIQNGAVDGTKLDPAISISTSGMVTSAVATTRDFRIYAAVPSNFYVGMLADPAMIASYTLTWPDTGGTSGQVLTSDGAGKMKWETPSSAGITDLTGDVTASGPGSAVATVATVGTSTAVDIHTAEVAANAATEANTPDTIVKRDASGGFSAGAISAGGVSSTGTMTASTATVAGAVTQGSSVYKDSGSNTVTVSAPSLVTSSYVLRWPTEAGSASQVLTTDSSGNLSWTTMTGAPTGAAGGDLSGAYPDPTVAKLQGNVVSSTTLTAGDAGQVFSWNGTSFAARWFGISDLKTSTGASQFADAACSTNQTLNWSSLTDSFSCVGISNLDASAIASGMFDPARLGAGTADASTYLRGDGAWASIASSQWTTHGPNISYDGGGNVGIGTTSPAYALDVVSPGNGVLSLTSTSAGGAAVMTIEATGVGGRGYSLISTTNGQGIGGGKFLITDSALGTVRMTIDSTGNVGIGTSAPSALLDVAGAIRVAGTGSEACDATHYVGGIRYQAGNIEFCNGTSWTPLGVAGSGLTELTGDVTATGSGSVAATVTSVGGSTAALVHSAEVAANAATDENTASRIVKRDASGNFSAGVASLASAQVSSVVFKDSGSNTVTVQAPSSVASSYVLKWPTSAGGSDQVLSTDASGNLSWIDLSTSLPPSGAAGGDLSGTYPDPTVATVGTSTAADIHTAEVAANAATALNTSDKIVLRDGGGDFAANVATLNGLALKNASSVVNLTSPAGASYSLALPSNLGTSGQVLTTNGSGSTSWTTPLTSTDGFVNGGNSFGTAADLGTNDGFDLNLKTNGATAMTVTSSGNVGIGTTAPAAPLHVIATTGTATYFDSFGGAGAYRLRTAAGTPSAPSAVSSGSVIGNVATYGYASTTWSPGAVTAIKSIAAEDFTDSSTGASLAFFTTAVGTAAQAETMRIDASGNVGIGTTSPGYKLDVVGSINASALKINGVDVSAGAASQWTTTGSNISYSGGNVGIGTANPGGVFSVDAGVGTGTASKILINSRSNSYGQVQIMNDDGKEVSLAYIGNGTAFGTHPASSSGDTFIWNQGTGLYDSLGSQYSVANASYGAPSFALDSNGGAAFGTYAAAIQTALPPVNGLIVSGNVGIGTTAPAAKLQVQGQAVSNQYDVTGGASVDFNNGNVQTLASVGASEITLANMIGGGSYTLVVTDSTSRTYTFSGCANSYFQPANGATTAGKQTVYTLLAIKSGSNMNCYISWITGF